MKHFLVTGGAGFIGANLCKRLLADGHHVTCLDNFHSGSKKNIEPFLANKYFTFIEHDIIQPINLKVDAIYNLACPASPPHYQKDPVYTLKVNVLGMLNMLELANANNAPILQTSTSEVYGDPLEHPQNELYRGNVNPIGPRACYDEGKRAAETLCFDYHRMHGTNIKVVRIFNTYGPQMLADDGRVVSNFITQSLKGAPITIYGDGSQTRSFCYVDDMVEGLIKMMGANVTGPINLGNPDEYTVKEIAEKIKALTKSSSAITFKPLPTDDPLRRKPDIAQAKVQLGWQPTIKLEEGLKKAISYFAGLAE